MTSYIGRFAPSPSGPLHFGSLVCALASYLDAKKHGGKWLLRIEDIDPPREIVGARESILNTLSAHHLHWDGNVVLQSQQKEHYENDLALLKSRRLAYRCNCTRKRLSRLSSENSAYDRHCLHHPPNKQDASSLRLNVEEALRSSNLSPICSYDDVFQGRITQNLLELGDFVVHRKDGLFAYQLAVVSDDITQGITHVVRGCDLLETTLQQKLLHHILASKATPPSFAHTPLIVDNQNRKLSKQNHAPAINNSIATSNIQLALKALSIHLDKPNNDTRPEQMISLALERWPSHLLQNSRTIRYSDLC